MNIILFKLQEIFLFANKIMPINIWVEDSNLTILSWVLIALFVLIVFALIVLVLIKMSFKIAFGFIKKVWKYAFWWWLKWVLLFTIILFITILVIQGLGIWIGTADNFWWVINGLGMNL